RLDQLLAHPVRALLELRRDVAFLVLARDRAGLVEVRLAREQIHDPTKILTLADRQLRRDRMLRHVATDLVAHLVEVRMLLVHHRHEKKSGNPARLAVFPEDRKSTRLTPVT